jgi:Kef-type K+ transport system membrane component KefB
LTEWFGREALLGLVVVFVMLFASVSEALGSHYVIGAFFGALLLDRKLFLKERYKDFEQTLHSVTDGFLAPVFFAFLGLQFQASAMRSWDIVGAVLITAIISKIVAGYVSGKLIGMKNRTAVGLGIILNGRGIMELVVANIALEHKFIGPGLFSTLVLMGVVTTLITPILFRNFALERNPT